MGFPWGGDSVAFKSVFLSAEEEHEVSFWEIKAARREGIKISEYPDTVSPEI